MFSSFKMIIHSFIHYYNYFLIDMLREQTALKEDQEEATTSYIQW